MQSRNFSSRLLSLIIFLFAVFFTFPAHSKEFDHSLYDGILRSYVNSDGLVNYEGLRRDSLQDLESYLDQLAKADVSRMDPYEKLPFWINAFNAHVISQILTRADIKSIDRHLDLFDVPLQVAQGTYSLNNIKQRILRGKTHKNAESGPIPGVTLEVFDPRVHFSLSNGTVGAPPLRNFAYTARNVEASLRENSILFANDPKFLALREGRLRISGLMKRYGEDFTSLGGVHSYLNRLIDPAKRKDADAVKKQLVDHYDRAVFEDDWTVNDIRHAKTRRPALLRAPK
jgi:hypothetical protein